MNDTHIRLLRRIAAVRRKALRDSASTVPADSSGERVERLTRASARADAQLTAATNRRRRRADHLLETSPLWP
jgi:hypothetical protein